MSSKRAPRLTNLGRDLIEKIVSQPLPNQQLRSAFRAAGASRNGKVLRDALAARHKTQAAAGKIQRAWRSTPGTWL